jgi:serine/threonine protein kinase
MCVFSQLLGVLYEFRRKRVIHRDLKPENIIISEGLHVYVCDFGLATRTIDSEGCMFSSKFCGTPRYFAPEIFDRREYSFKTDSYAIGLILYEMLTLHSPYKGENYVNLRREVIRKAPEFKKGFIPDKTNDVELLLGNYIYDMTHGSSTKRNEIQTLMNDSNFKKILAKYTTNKHQKIAEFGESFLRYTDPPINIFVPPPYYKPLPPSEKIEDIPFVGNVDETVIYTPQEKNKTTK